MKVCIVSLSHRFLFSSTDNVHAYFIVYYTLRQKLSATLYFYRYFVYINTAKTLFLHFLKDYTKGSTITNLRSIHHPERRDYDVAKMGFKTSAGKI
jgi:hypothetical protein